MTWLVAVPGAGGAATSCCCGRGWPRPSSAGAAEGAGAEDGPSEAFSVGPLGTASGLSEAVVAAAAEVGPAGANTALACGCASGGGSCGCFFSAGTGSCLFAAELAATAAPTTAQLSGARRFPPEAAGRPAAAAAVAPAWRLGPSAAACRCAELRVRVATGGAAAPSGGGERRRLAFLAAGPGASPPFSAGWATPALVCRARASRALAAAAAPGRNAERSEGAGTLRGAAAAARVLGPQGASAAKFASTAAGTGPPTSDAGRADPRRFCGALPGGFPPRGTDTASPVSGRLRLQGRLTPLGDCCVKPPLGSSSSSQTDVARWRTASRSESRLSFERRFSRCDLSAATSVPAFAKRRSFRKSHTLGTQSTT